MATRDERPVTKKLVRFFPDFGERSCLWMTEDDNITPDATDLGASQETEDRIGAWFDVWERHHHWEKGWDDVERYRAWKREGHALVALLREELDGEEFEIEPRF